MKSVKELTEEIADLDKNLDEFATAKEQEPDLKFSDDEIARSESWLSRRDEAKAELEALNRLNRMRVKSAILSDSPDVVRAEPARGWTKKKAAQAFKAWVHYQSGNQDLIRSDMRQAAYDLGVDLQSRDYIVRDQSTTNSEGGYTLGGQNYSGLEKTLKYFGGIASVCDYQSVSDGRGGFWATINDTANSAAAVNELAGAANTAITVGQVAYVFYKIGSGAFPVSNELLTDSLENWDQIVNEVLGERVGRKVATHCTTGNLTSSKGFMLETTQGKAATDDTTFTPNELLDLYHSVDPAYRNDPSCYWYMNDSTLCYLRKQVDDMGKPVFMDSYMGGDTPTILGKKIIICNDMADIAASAKPVAFGAASKFKVRVVGTPTVRRLDEIAADDDCVVFLTHLRLTSRLVVPTAIKHLTMAAS